MSILHNPFNILGWFCHRHYLTLPVLILVSFILSTSTVLAQVDAGGSDEDILLGIVHLNFDCYPDTLFGARDSSLRSFIPHTVAWGRSGVRSGEINPTDTSCGDQIPPYLKHHRTSIILPNWLSRSVSMAFEQMNGDTLVDLVFHVRGYEIEQDGKQVLRRTAIALFGQSGLDTATTLDLTAISEFHSTPFFAMELRKGRDFIEPAVRDLSGRTSWVLLAPEIIMPQAPALQAASVGSATTLQSVKMYPNPAGNTLTLEIAGLARGSYTVELVAANGVRDQHRDITISDKGYLAETLNLERTPSGYYAVRVIRAGGIIGSWGVLVRK